MKIKVGVFFGGRSVEHEVSIISGLQAIHAMDKEKYDAVPIYITKEGIWYTGEELLQIDNYKDTNKLLAKCNRLMMINTGTEKLMYKYPLSRFGSNLIDSLDVIFPVMHGTNGEDGSLQGAFETMYIPYVGCDVLSSAVGMDKIVTKKVLKDADIPVLDYIWFYSSDYLKDTKKVIESIENKIKYPMIVKPANVGSSVGISKVNNMNELEDAIELARNFSHKILVEEMVVNLKEINCSVLGDFENARASVCEEPVSSKDILTYQDKYLSSGGSKGMSGATRKIPADISEEMRDQVQRLAVDTFKTIGCSGVVRIDFLIDLNSDKVYVNEVNTIPGSLAFYLWEATGMSFSEMIDNLIQLALKKNREKDALKFTYETNILSLQGGLKGGIKGVKGH